MENKKTTETFDIFELLKKAKTHGLETLSDKVERGKKIIDPDLIENWISDAVNDTFGCFCGYITEAALEILEAISEGKSEEEIEEITAQKRIDGMPSDGIDDLVKKYSKKERSNNLSLAQMARARKEK